MVLQASSFPRLRLFGGSSLAVLALGSALPAQAACTSNGAGTVVCDTSAPNPEPGGAAGSTIAVRSGSVVELLDPYAGAAVRRDTVILFADGSLTTEASSLIHDTVIGGHAIDAAIGSSLNLSGDVSVRRDNSIGVQLGQGSTLTLNQSGAISNIAGTVRGAPGGPAVTLGSGDDRVTIVTGASVTGLVDGGAGADGQAGNRAYF